MRKLELSIIGSFILFATLIGCQKKAEFVDIEIIGHAGNGLDNVNTFYHDNSLESITMALSTNGCDGVELDVQISLDGTLWLYHDSDLASETSGQGCIPSSSDAYLTELNYKSAKKERLIKLSDIPSDHLIGKIVYIDARSLNLCDGSEVDLSQYVSELNDFRIDNSSAERIVVITGSLLWLTTFSAEGYNVMAQITSISHYQELIASFPLLDEIVVANGDISKEDVSLIQANGQKVVIVDVRSSIGTRKAFKKLPNGLMTDNIRNALIEKY